MATANALAHERAKVLERQLANCQELLTKKHTELTTTTASLTKQLQEATQERDKHRERADEQVKLHKGAVIRHSQGQPLAERYLPLVPKLRQQHQCTIEQALVERLRSPISTTDELAATLAQVGKGYAVKSINPQEFSFISKYDGTRFNSSELRPNGRDFLEQFREVIGQRRAQEQTFQLQPKSNEIEI